MKRVQPQAFGLFAAILCLLTTQVLAHSIPELPVRGSFKADGQAEITVEANPRSSLPNATEAPSLEYKTFRQFDETRKAELIQQARVLIGKSVEFVFEPLGRVQPDFEFDFVAEGGQPLKADDDAVVVRGRWKTTIPSGLTGWKVRSLPGHKTSVVFMNTINGNPHPRFAVLFPGETSFTLDLTTLGAVGGVAHVGAVSATEAATDGWTVFVNYLRYGFTHVLPEGLDHILFVLGLFLLSRSWKPVLTQVTAFTLAHSCTLALAALGYLRVSPAIVEPVIALSIAAIALENILRPRYSVWRVAIVFCFGAVHGVGFASGLSEKPIPRDGFLWALTGFNVGVECAQLSVIILAFLATFWLRDESRYRRWVVLPGSALIALTGLFWAMQRVLWPEG